jgi:hypothetical protein
MRNPEPVAVPLPPKQPEVTKEPDTAIGHLFMRPANTDLSPEKLAAATAAATAAAPPAPKKYPKAVPVPEYPKAVPVRETPPQKTYPKAVPVE